MREEPGDYVLSYEPDEVDNLHNTLASRSSRRDANPLATLGVTLSRELEGRLCDTTKRHSVDLRLVVDKHLAAGRRRRTGDGTLSA